jgi:hypothetical protein
VGDDVSLAINPDHVTEVLLADGWHQVDDMAPDRSSFDLDSYEYELPHPDDNREGLVLHGGGQSGICATGFTFTEPVYEDGECHLCQITGPLTSILAVRMRYQPREET